MTGHTPGQWKFNEGTGEITSDIDGGEDFLVATVDSNDADGPVLAAASVMLDVIDMIIDTPELVLPQRLVRAARLAKLRATGET